MNNKETTQKLRIDTAAQCADAEYLPKVKNAGDIFTDKAGSKIQVMHNGIKVLADTYYGEFNTEIVSKLNGHHEPQEEKAFFEVLKYVKPSSTMIELGSYWSYYSLWFRQAVPNSKNYMVEPVSRNFELGKKNFSLNGFSGVFEQAFVGKLDSDEG